jgi:hypothetical protein
MVATASIDYSAHGMTCAKCGAGLFAPEWSKTLSNGCVFNLWSCARCGFCLGEVPSSSKEQTENPLDITAAA